MTKPIELTEFLKLVLWTAYIEPTTSGDKQVSCMIVANVEAGKTELMRQFSNNAGILYATDLTEYGLFKDYFEDLKSGAIKHIVIPDFIKSTNRKKETVDTFITFLNSFIEEGVSNVATFAMHFKLEKPIKGGLLTSIALDDFKRLKARLAAVGFLSRLLIVSYSYSQDHVYKIFGDIAMRKNAWDSISLPFPDKPIPVDLNPELAMKLIIPAQRIGERFKGFGFRAMHQFQSLACAAALADGRDKVTTDDIEKVVYLADAYMGFKFRRIKTNGCVDLFDEVAQKADKEHQGILLQGAVK